jgi:3-hydroxybutyryl-CoA dehydrogenase
MLTVAQVESRPMTIIGAGTLGRRIALMLATQGGEVRLYDTNTEPLEAGVAYVENNLPDLLPKIKNGKAGRVVGFTDLQKAVDNAWLVVEAVPEIADLKRRILGDLDRLSSPDAILASNSSSFPSSELIDNVTRPERVLSSHFYMPPRVIPVELMSCGKTEPGLIDLLMEQLPKYGLRPFRVRKESVGLIFNRVWAAIKRESLYVVAEGVATPQDVDDLYTLIIGGDHGPFRNMDEVGLDVVLAIEEHYATLRPGLPEEPRQLLRDYIAKGWLGVKTGRGFYDAYGGKAG